MSELNMPAARGSSRVSGPRGGSPPIPNAGGRKGGLNSAGIGGGKWGIAPGIGGGKPG